METNTSTTPSLTDWFNGTEYLVKLGFTLAEIEKAITDSGNSVETLTEIQGFKQFPKYYKRAELVKEKYSYTVSEYVNQNGKQYEARVNKTGVGVRVPAQYQGLKHGKILFTLFSNKWNWFTSFTKTKEFENKKYLSDLPISKIPEAYKDYTPAQLRHEYLIEKELRESSLWSIYEMREDGEIYLETSLGTLYVPIKALVEKNFSIIENRMISYATSYHDPINLSGFGLNHRGRTKEQYREDKINDYNKMIAPLQSAEALKLKSYFS